LLGVGRKSHGFDYGLLRRPWVCDWRLGYIEIRLAPAALPLPVELQVGHVASPDAKGDQVLQPRIENGVKIFDIEASIVRWNILPDVAVDAYANNRQLPGFRLQMTEGDHVRSNFHNALPESTTVHWHGLILPNEMDGPAKITQDPVPPVGSYKYEFDVGQTARTFTIATTTPTGSRRWVSTARC
jgi:FtsP/CotA-like multicopper oxidase with cupredoxin domain